MSKLASRELEPLDVADDVVDLEPELGGALLRGLDQDGREVEPGHVRARGGGALGDRARAAGKVEPAVARPGRQPLDDDLVDVGDRLGDPLVGPVAPHHALPLLELLVRHVASSSVSGRPQDGTEGVDLPSIVRA